MVINFNFVSGIEIIRKDATMNAATTSTQVETSDEVIETLGMANQMTCPNRNRL